MKRITIYLLSIFLLCGCSPKKTPLDASPEEFIKKFNNNCDYIFEGTNFADRAVEVDPIEQDGIKMLRYEINDKCGIFIIPDERGNINILSISAETTSDTQALAEAMLLRQTLLATLHGAEASKEISKALAVSPGEENIEYKYGGLLYIRVPDEGGVQTIAIRRAD